MRRYLAPILVGLLLILYSVIPGDADVKISALPAAGALAGTEEYPCVQAGTTSQCLPSQLLTYILGQGGTFGAGITLVPGTTSIKPLTMQSGTLNTTAAAGVSEFDGVAFYDSAAASSRQVRVDEQFISLTATYTLTSTTSAQKLFNTPTNGTFTTQANTSYRYDCSFSITSMSATSGNAGFDIKGGGTATIGNAAMWSNGLDATTLTTAAAQGGVFVASTGQAGDIVTATTGTGMEAHVWGMVRVTTAGTLIPSVSLTTAAAAVVGVNSNCRLWPIGSNSVTNVGNWS